MKVTFFDLENWREIAATLGRNKTRTFLTAFGIFWGTAMLALLWGASRGFEGIVSRQFAGLATNMGGVSPGTRSISYRGFNKGSSWNMNVADIAAIRRTAPAIEYSTELGFANARAINGQYSKNVRIIGVEAEYNLITSPVLYGGRLLNDSDVAGSRKVCLIGNNLANELFPDEDPVGRSVTIGGSRFMIIGRAGQLGEVSMGGGLDESILMPASTLRRAFNQGNNVFFFLYTAPRGHKPSDNKEAIRRVLSSTHVISPDDENAYDFMDVSDMFDMVNKLFMGISLVALFIGGSSLMAGVIGVGNIMWIIVRERTHEFGVRRALGARPADITMQVLSESVVLTLVAGTAGVCFAAAILAAVEHATAKPMLPPAGFQLSFGVAMTIVFMFLVLGSAAGTLPAVKAMKIKPIEAIREK